MKQKDIVRKDNMLVDRVKYKLSLREQKFILWGISKIKKTDMELKEYTFKAVEFGSLAKIGEKEVYDVIKKLSLSLMRKPLLFQDSNQSKKWKLRNWFSGVDYDNGTVSFTFHPDLKPYLTDLKEQYTMYQLENAMGLKSSYSIRIYELLKQYQNTQQKEREITLDNLRTHLGLEDKYPLYGDLKRKTILVAKIELEARTDIRFEYDEIKEGRKVVSILFKIESNSAERKELPHSVNEQYAKNEDFVKLLAMVRDDEKEKTTLQSSIYRSLKKDGFDYVKQHIQYANEKAMTNYRSFLGKGLKENWAGDFKAKEDVKKLCKEGDIIQLADGFEGKVFDGHLMNDNDNVHVPAGPLYQMLKSGEAKNLGGQLF